MKLLQRIVIQANARFHWLRAKTLKTMKYKKPIKVKQPLALKLAARNPVGNIVIRHFLHD
jgi:hypothetical protein